MKVDCEVAMPEFTSFYFNVFAYKDIYFTYVLPPMQNMEIAVACLSVSWITQKKTWGHFVENKSITKIFCLRKYILLDDNIV